MQPTTYTGDPEFIDEAKEGMVQSHPALALINNLSARTPADELYNRFFDILKSLSTSTFAEQAKYALLRLERQTIDEAVLLMAQADLPKETKPATALKPVEVYRRFADTLRKIGTTSKVYGLDAIQTLREIYLAQTQPDGELETRFWVDAMTGETDPEFAITEIDIPDVHVLSPEGGLQSVLTEMDKTIENAARFKRPIEISQWQTWCIRRSAELQADLGWTNEVRWAWVEAQGSASGSGEIEDIDEPDDDRGYVPPTMTKDLVKEGEDTVVDKSCFFPLAETMRAFNQARKAIFAQMTKDNVKGPQWKHTFQRRIRKTDEFEQMKAAIQHTADNYGAKEATAVYLRVAGDYGLMSGQDEAAFDDNSMPYDDVSDIVLDPHKSIASITNFGEFLAEYETEISEAMADGSIGVFTTSESEVDSFVAQTMDMIAHRYPSHDHNALNTASWNIAYQKAIASGASFPDADARAWEAWRYAMSFFAAKEYDRVMKIERNRTKAMAAFWRFAPPSVPRPQDKIVSVNKNGLVFKKRNVTWGIAKLKLTMDELEIDKPLALRLCGILKSKGWGNGFEKQLALKFSIK